MKSLRFADFFSMAQWCLRLGIYGLITAVIINGLLAFATIFSMAGDWGKVIGDGLLNLENLTPKTWICLHPRKMNGWNLKITQLKSGKSSEPNHHFQLPAVNLPGCTDWAFPKRKGLVSFRKCRLSIFVGIYVGKFRGAMSFSLGATLGRQGAPVIFYGRAVIFHWTHDFLEKE